MIINTIACLYLLSAIIISTFPFLFFEDFGLFIISFACIRVYYHFHYHHRYYVTIIAINVIIILLSLLLLLLTKR